MAELHIRTGDGDEHAVELTGEPVTFGRDDSCDFVLTEQRASRHHCTFFPVGEGWRVEDNQSSNGTWLGGKPVLSARLQPGDEIEIGLTVMTYVGKSAERAEVVRVRKPRRKGVPLGLLGIPVALGVVFWVVTGFVADAGAATARDAWTATARLRLDRINLEHRGDADARRGALESLERELTGKELAVQGLQLVRSSLKDGGESGDAGVPDGSGGNWRGALDGLIAAGDRLPIEERRARLVRLLDRHLDDPEALAAIRDRLGSSIEELAARSKSELERTESLASVAAEEGRFGAALDHWTTWRLRAPVVSRAQERRIAGLMAAIRTKAESTAKLDAKRFDDLVAEGRKDAADELLDGAIERLRGTGYEVWLEVRSGRRAAGAVVPTGLGGVARGAEELESTRQLNRALRALANADQLARVKQFMDAARRLREIAPDIADATLRGEIEERASLLEAETTFVQHVLAVVTERPRDFSPLKLDDGSYRVDGATTDGLILTKGRAEKAEIRAFVTLPAEAVLHLVERAEPGLEHALAAAMVLRDFGSETGYVAWMRTALGVDADRLDVSRVHARMTGVPLPTEGFMPHPEKDGGVITYEEWQAIQNAEKIARYAKEYTALVDKIEATKQAKSIQKVAKVYAKLEAARNHALELIFDTEKYFYPYKDRMQEYEPVKREVMDRVAAVREIWANKVSAQPRRDKALDALLERAEELSIEVNYYGGDCEQLDDRVSSVEQYLGDQYGGLTLTLRTFFETREDRKLLAYNEEVLERNAAMETVATDDEREQVRITNEYRILMGHRQCVVIQDQLTMAARGHSDDMSRLGFFAHFSPVPGKHGPGDRVQLAGYPMEGCSENIHMGSGNPQGAHDGWERSSGHHRNILTPHWVELGVGRSGRYWTQNFGYRSGIADWK